MSYIVSVNGMHSMHIPSDFLFFQWHNSESSQSAVLIVPVAISIHMLLVTIHRSSLQVRVGSSTKDGPPPQDPFSYHHLSACSVSSL
jgi:hypothetical protein